jgi:hypothetical protein
MYEPFRSYVIKGKYVLAAVETENLKNSSFIMGKME